MHKTLKEFQGKPMMLKLLCCRQIPGKMAFIRLIQDITYYLAVFSHDQVCMPRSVLVDLQQQDDSSSVTPVSIQQLRKFSIPVLLAFVFAATQAQADPLILNGSYTELCAHAASHIDDPGNIVLTGSRVAASPLELCTIAINMDSAVKAQLISDYINRGVIHFAQDALELALIDFDTAISLEDDLGRAHLNRAYTLMAMRRWEDSIAAFDRSLELGVEELDRAYYNRGIAHEETGNLLQAYLDYRKAAELNPEWEDPRNELARFRVR